MNFIYKSRLFKQLVSVIGLIVILSIGIPGVFTLFYLTPRFVEERYYQVMINDVDFLAARLDWHLSKSLKDVEYLSKRIGLSSSNTLNEAGQVMEIFIRGSSIFTGGILTDSKGIVKLFYSSPQGLVELIHQKDISYGEYIQVPLKKNQLFLSNVITLNKNTPPVIFVSSPVEENGQTTGALALSINLWNSDNIFHSLFQGFQSEKQGTLYVVDGHGTIIYHENKDMVGETVSDPGILSCILSNKEGIEERIVTDHGVLAAAFGKLKKNNWVVVYEMSHDSIYALGKVSGDMSIGTMLIVLALGLLVSVIFARIIMRPLEEITIATEQVAAGDLARRIDYRGHPDFRRVIKNFNIMTTNLRVQYEELEKLSLHDYLTGLANRRYFEQQLSLELDRAYRLGHPSTLLMLDVDDFKIINDKFGHLEGDKILKALAAVLKETVREVDLPVRFGGEEFLVLLPETSLEKGRIVAEKIQEGISQIKVSSRKGTITLTVSIGMSSTEQIDEMKAILSINASLTLIKQADEALYRAKTKGKNRVEIYTPK